MTFPLGSLRAEGGASAVSATGTYTRDCARAAPPPAHSPGLIRAQLRLLIGAVLGVLGLLALATHNGLDPAFSTSGSSAHVANKAGVIGAWFSDLAFFLFGYSFWWVLVVGARAWLGALARVLRSES